MSKAFHDSNKKDHDKSQKKIVYLLKKQCWTFKKKITETTFTDLQS
jgi:hypothetical protein